jgi:prepilin-type N-terminal cleavage/methylation domain-containing protein
MRKIFTGGARRGRGGFSLVEVLVVILIMGILVGVVASLMANFITNFEVTDDQSIARRRAQDVFNILHLPLLYAGMGIPGDGFSYYFGGIGTGSGTAPISSWDGPVDVYKIVSGAASSDKDGPRMRLVYAISSNVKNIKSGDLDTFSEPAGSVGAAVQDVELELSGSIETDTSGIDPNKLTPANNDASPKNVHSYITFPGIRMHPEYVKSHNPTTKKLTVDGLRPQVDPAIALSDDVLPRNVIRAFHDMYFVRAGVAFVADNGSGTPTFYFADVTSADVSTAATGNNLQGYSVEGIKAIYFESETSNGVISNVTVYVIAEGDNTVSERDTSSAASQAFRTWPRWAGVTFEQGRHYEEFQMNWRTRNVEGPGA